MITYGLFGGFNVAVFNISICMMLEPAYLISFQRLDIYNQKLNMYVAWI
jgi:hypothetical protein